MQFLKLAVQNFGIYRGLNEFLLAPSESTSTTPRNITVVCGHNGAGKSTLFEALGVALHGAASLGDRVTRQNYNDFLLSSLHRFQHGATKEVSAEGSVAVTFLYIQAGRPKRIWVERRWRRSVGGVRETLSVLEDGKRPDIDPSDYQAWINDLVPPSIASVCFFDAEQLNVFSSPQMQEGLLHRTLRRVLGLDIIERLELDLDAYTLKAGGKLKTTPLREQVLKHQQAVEALDVMIREREDIADAFSNQRGGLLGRIAQKERELTAEGGSYAARRPALKDRLVATEQEAEELKHQLQEIAGDLLPFALAPELCRSLSTRLDAEAAVARESVARELVRQEIRKISAALDENDFWAGLHLSSQAQTELLTRIKHLLAETDAPSMNSVAMIHNLSEEERGKLQSWSLLALESIPQRTCELGNRLKAVEDERRSITTELDRSPDEARLAALHAELAGLHEQRRGLEADESPILEELRALRIQREAKIRERQRAHDQLAIAQASETELALANRSKRALSAYRDAFTRERIIDLEVELVRAFNSLCRKEHLLGAAHIDASDGRITLVGVDGHAVSLSDFSAGERQLYGLALLESLRIVSGRRLPLAIDTPLARLDDAHRTRLLREYFPRVSNQVLLFATDVELDEALLGELEPNLARVYRLEFNPHEETTRVTCVSAGGELYVAAVDTLDASVFSA